jgi:hypothetical protein
VHVRRMTVVAGARRRPGRAPGFDDRGQVLRSQALGTRADRRQL